MGWGVGVRPHQSLLEPKPFLGNVKHLTSTPPTPHNHLMRAITLFEDPQVTFNLLAKTGYVCNKVFDMRGKVLTISQPGVIMEHCTILNYGGIRILANNVTICYCVFDS